MFHRLIKSLNYFNIWFQVFADLLVMFVRTSTFVLLILHSAENAVLAFSIAQILSILSYVLFFYGYFVFYTKVESKILKESGTPPIDFPFHSICDFLPKYIKNDVSILICDVLNIFCIKSEDVVLILLLTVGTNWLQTANSSPEFLKTRSNDANTYPWRKIHYDFI